MLQVPKLASVNVSEGTVYSMRFDNRCGWAVAIVSDATGMLSITSDWGNWSFRWNLRGMPDGCTLTQFLPQCDGDYVARKMLGSTQQYDPDATERAWKARICELRRERVLGHDEAREAWNEIAAFDWEQRESYPDIPAICEPWEMIRMADSTEYTAITKIVWPAFREVLRDRAKAAA